MLFAIIAATGRMNTTPTDPRSMIERRMRTLVALTAGGVPRAIDRRQDRNSMFGMIDTRPMLTNSASLAMSVQVWK